MIKEWLGYDDTQAVLKGPFETLGGDLVGACPTD
jgi:hypothetical protein